MLRLSPPLQYKKVEIPIFQINSNPSDSSQTDTSLIEWNMNSTPGPPQQTSLQSFSFYSQEINEN